MRSPRGFTLIELLVTVFIIAVLLAILVPSISIAIDHAEKTHCLANIHAQHSAQVTYAFDHNRRFAPHDNFSPDYQRSGNRPNIVELMRRTYVQDTRMMICPVVARVPSQANNEYRSNDWMANGIFGGWDTDADYTNTAYMWLANFSGTRMFDAVPAPPDEKAPEDLSLPRKPGTVQMLNGEPPLARSLGEADHARTFITHKINFFISSSSPTNLQDVAHDGNGNWQMGEPYDGYKASEQPLGFGDGHVLMRPREQIKPRICIGGNYPVDPGTIGTFLW
jgi:prepilin-type N-terminal cleavage/methylation domain-containing protein